MKDRWNTLHFSFIVSLFLMISVYAGAQEQTRLPANMASLGDSITAGCLASHRRQTSYMPMKDLYLIGRTIARNKYAENQSVDDRYLSWAAGLSSKWNLLHGLKRVKSHAYRLHYLNKAQGKKFVVRNFAVSGALALNVFMDELPRVFKWSKETLKQKGPDYVTFLVGANDVCADRLEDMTNSNVFKFAVSETLKKLLKANSKTQILVSSIPKIDKLLDVASDAPVLGFSTCKEMWKLTNTCGLLFQRDDENVRHAVEAKIAEFNEILVSVTDELRALYGDRIRYSESFYNAEFDPDQLAVDCFHPNDIGQNFLSELTWSEGWWEKEWQDYEDNRKLSSDEFEPSYELKEREVK
jgi:lysophospholipase L1-like esterase